LLRRIKTKKQICKRKSFIYWALVVAVIGSPIV
jgi:hypothetical protein